MSTSGRQARRKLLLQLPARLTFRLLLRRLPCRHSGQTPVVLRRQFLLNLGPAYSDIMTSGDYEARHLTQRRPAIILRQGAVAVLWSFPLQLQPPESAQLNGCGAARCGLFRGVGVTRDIGSVRRRRPTTTTCL